MLCVCSAIFDCPLIAYMLKTQICPQGLHMSTKAPQRHALRHSTFLGWGEGWGEGSTPVHLLSPNLPDPQITQEWTLDTTIWMLCLKVGLARTPCTTQYPPCTPYNLCLKTASQIPRTTGQSVGEPDKKTPTPPHPFKECLDFLPFKKRHPVWTFSLNIVMVKMVILRAFDIKMSRVAFTHFCR